MTGAALLRLGAPACPCGRLIHKWKGWARLRTIPELVAREAPDEPALPDGRPAAGAIGLAWARRRPRRVVRSHAMNESPPPTLTPSAAAEAHPARTVAAWRCALACERARRVRRDLHRRLRRTGCRFARICVAGMRRTSIRTCRSGCWRRTAGGTGWPSELARAGTCGLADLPPRDYGWGFVKLEPLFGPAGRTLPGAGRRHRHDRAGAGRVSADANDRLGRSSSTTNARPRPRAPALLRLGPAGRRRPQIPPPGVPVQLRPVVRHARARSAARTSPASGLGRASSRCSSIRGCS